MAILLGGVLALWIAVIVWAITSDRQGWKEIESDTALLEALCRPGTWATVRELGQVVQRRHPEGMRDYNPIDIGRALKAASGRSMTPTRTCRRRPLVGAVLLFAAACLAVVRPNGFGNAAKCQLGLPFQLRPKRFEHAHVAFRLLALRDFGKRVPVVARLPQQRE